jgi:hypothetical protein
MRDTRLCDALSYPCQSRHATSRGPPFAYCNLFLSLCCLFLWQRPLSPRRAQRQYLSNSEYEFYKNTAVDREADRVRRSK